MSLEQFDIFGEEQNDAAAAPGKRLWIVLNGMKKELDITEIFDAQKYEELYAISYVSSPSFFSKHTKGFLKVAFILGINDNANLEKFKDGIALIDSLNIEEKISFWNGLDEETRQQVIQNRLDIRYGTTNVIIHDKIYLLKNDKTKEYRVIIGSANFSNSAFCGKNQFENIRIDDDKKLFDLYMERFMEVYENTNSYIPDRFIRGEKPSEAVIVKTGEVMLEALMEDITKNNRNFIITEESVDQIKDLKQEITYRKEEIDKTDEIIKLIVQKNKGHYGLKPLSQISKASVAIKTIFCGTNKKTVQMDERPFLSYYEKTNYILTGTGNGNELEVLSQEADKESVKKSLLKINKFVEAYRIFAKEPSPNNQSKVMEILFYTFMGAHIWKIRAEAELRSGSEKAKHDICPFMIIGGESRSGKTTALGFAARLIGNNGKSAFQYKEIASPGILLDMFKKSNLSPIFVDEIEPSFFRNKSSDRVGAGLIKTITNNATGMHPILIGTTNKTEFNSDPAVIRRIYYLEINNIFDEKRRVEADKYQEEISQDLDNTLYKDFTYRLAKKIKNDDIFYSTEDVLAPAREIFKQYYQECEIPVPEWFPLKPFNDYEKKKMSTWELMFIAQPHLFKDKGNTILFFIDDICQNNKKKREELINLIDPVCIKNGHTIGVLELHKQSFLRFINHGRYKEGFFRRLKELFRADKAAI